MSTNSVLNSKPRNFKPTKINDFTVSHFCTVILRKNCRSVKWSKSNVSYDQTILRQNKFKYKSYIYPISIHFREFKIQCKGVGVHPPLELSKQIVHFAATSLYDVSTASLHVINSHTSTNEFTHPVPRIGKGL